MARRRSPTLALFALALSATPLVVSALTHSSSSHSSSSRFESHVRLVKKSNTVTDPTVLDGRSFDYGELGPVSCWDIDRVLTLWSRVNSDCGRWHCWFDESHTGGVHGGITNVHSRLRRARPCRATLREPICDCCGRRSGGRRVTSYGRYPCSSSSIFPCKASFALCRGTSLTASAPLRVHRGSVSKTSFHSLNS